MFSMRKSIAGSRHWDRAFLTELGFNLAEAGFTKITVKLPVDLASLMRDAVPVEERIDSELRNRELPLHQFIDRELNYRAVILVAANPRAHETIKVLFVNTSAKTSFADPTFPSGHSVPSQLYVQSLDPGRTYSLFHFFFEYLKTESESHAILAFFAVLFLFLVAGEILSFLATGRGLLQTLFHWSALADILAIAAMLIVEYAFFKAPTGLSVNDRRTATAGSFLSRAFRGEFKDNPLVAILLSIIATIIGAVVLKLLGWP
jgi:hypothetical protein